MLRMGSALRVVEYFSIPLIKNHKNWNMNQNQKHGVVGKFVEFYGNGRVCISLLRFMNTNHVPALKLPNYPLSREIPILPLLRFMNTNHVPALKLPNYPLSPHTAYPYCPSSDS
ncbi:hypothetical protein VNO77_33824 [Canavalia gladiata]|uniref:Uncharacterized protein n=1 Tax=Canavalia gladiata TaxID=3824 RepID=A0AAN9KD50_CANGL